MCGKSDNRTALSWLHLGHCRHKNPVDFVRICAILSSEVAQMSVILGVLILSIILPLVDYVVDKLSA